MENLARRTELQMEALNPPIRSLPPFPSPARRRSHLNSSTYRTLVLILSHCLDESLTPPPQDPLQDPSHRSDSTHLEEPEGVSTRKDPIVDRNGSELSKDPVCGNPRSDGSSNQNLVLVEKLGHGEGQLKDPSSEKQPLDDFRDESLVGEQDRKENLGFTNPKLESLRDESFDSLEILEIDDECLNSDVLSDIVLDCARLIDAQDDLFNSVDGLQDRKEEVGHGEHVNSVLKDRIRRSVDDLEFKERQERKDECVSGSNPEVPKSVVSQYEIEHGEARNEKHSKCFSDESTKDMAFEKPATVEAWDGSFKFMEEIKEGMKQESHTCSDPLMNCSGLRTLVEEDQASSLVGLADNEEVEEGEIPNELQEANQYLDLVHESADFDVQKLEKRTRENCFREETSNTVIYDSKQGVKHASGVDRCLKPQKNKSFNGTESDAKSQDVIPDTLGSLEENSENLAIKNKKIPADIKAVEVPVKRIRGPLTEERKAKKKKAKKRKRAQKDREQGVKRLKLQPIVKLKTVKYCNFYLMGRCQQGDLCKFSHDTTPLTKSQPCKHFACDSCLKGDDCPFDHQLSKYPCHNYMSKGMCHRGDRCKFSHKLPTTEAPSPAPITSKSDSPLSSRNSNLRKQFNMNSTSQGANDPPKSTAKPLEGNLVNSPKEPRRPPNGIRFLSFGKGPAGSTNEHKDNLHLEKNCGIRKCTLQNQEKLVVGHKNALNSSLKSLPEGHSESKMMSSRSECRPAVSSFANTESKNSSFSSGSASIPPCRSLQTEVSVASKLLEEFLFCGGS